MHQAVTYCNFDSSCWESSRLFLTCCFQHQRVCAGAVLIIILSSANAHSLWQCVLARIITLNSRNILYSQTCLKMVFPQLGSHIYNIVVSLEHLLSCEGSKLSLLTQMLSYDVYSSDVLFPVMALSPLCNFCFWLSSAKPLIHLSLSAAGKQQQRHKLQHLQADFVQSSRRETF